MSISCIGVKDEFQITSKDRFAFTSSIGFGASLRQLFSPFFSGATLVCFDSSLLKVPSLLFEHLQKKRVSIFNVPPIVMEQMLSVSSQKGDLSDLRWLLVGGDLFPTHLAKQWFERFGTNIVNLYGSTESIINASFYKFHPSFDEHSFLPVGRPRPDFTFHLQDGQGQAIEACHRSGHLIIESPFLAQGYHNRREETAFYQRKGRCFYKTGDVAMKLPSGDYLVLGRSDRQVQVYGQRVELDEIENTLNQHPKVKRSFVVHVQSDSLHKICAYVQSENISFDLKDLRGFLKERLPSFMIPHHIETLEQPQTTHHQKIDYQKLKNLAKKKYFKIPTLYREDQESLHQNIKSKLKSIWSKHLGGVKEIGLEDSFFDLGGDSIMAVEVYHDICHAFQLNNLSPFVFYTSPTIQKLSLEIIKAQVVDPTPVVATKSSMSLKERLSFTVLLLKVLKKLRRVRSLFHWKKGVKRGPISPQQRSFILVKQLLGLNCNACFCVPVKGFVDLAVLKQNLEKISLSQESLRTYFIGDEQIVLPRIEIDILFYDLSQDASVKQKRHIHNVNEQLLYAKSRFSKPPLFKVVLFKTSKDDFVLTFCINHILADGQSLYIFLSQFNRAYRQEKLDPAPSHIDYTLSYKKYCQKQYEYHRAFWKQKLKGLKDYNKSLQVQKHITESDDEILHIDQNEVDFLSQKYSTTPFYILMTLWGQAFAQIMNMQKIVFFATYHNRSFPFSGLPYMMAPIARMIPLLLDLSSSIDFKATLEQITRAYLEVLDHVDFNVFKYFYSYKESYLIGFNYIDLNPLSKTQVCMPFQMHLEEAELHFSERNASYIYLFLSVHSYSQWLKFGVYGRSSRQEKQAIVLFMKNQIQQLLKTK